jgi:3'-phosphoadenosine 5'-phosphosulfate sulfotransferase (PAPS reductase)/FAD synthetase
MQQLPLSVKLEKTKQRIREWYEHWNGNVYVAFSGGKDSTVLLHVVRSLYPDVPAVFVDTGLEFPEIKAFVKHTNNVIPLTPDMNFRKTIEVYGYPVISKEQATYINRIRQNPDDKEIKNRYLNGITANGGTTDYTLSNKWMYLIGAPFKISAECCSMMKRYPFIRFEKQTKVYPFIGTLASESAKRMTAYLHHGCNAFELVRPHSRPLSFWTATDIWEYIKYFNVPYSEIYDMGYKSTGCVFCAFGVHLEEEPNRFQRLRETHPKLYKYCFKEWEKGGLGMGKVLDYIKVPYENYYKQMEVSDLL